MFQKLVINKIIELLSRQFKLFDILKYVKEPNELDIKVKKLEKENKSMKSHLKRLDNIAHPPFFTAEEKANMEDRIKQLEAADYSMRLRDKENG